MYLIWPGRAGAVTIDMAAAAEELEFGDDIDAEAIDPECKDDGEEEEESVDNEFTLDEVLRLGGTKADYLMLHHLNENEELVDGGKKSAIDDLEEGELEAFVQKIGIRKYAKIVQEDEESAKDEKQAKKEGIQIDKKGKKNKNKELNEKIQDGKTNAKGQPGKTGKQKDNQESSTSEIPGRKTKYQDIFEFHPKQYLLVKPGGKWYDVDYANEHTSEPQDESFVSQYKNLAKQLYEHETKLYSNKKNLQKGANSTWMKTVVTTGTLADRMAAMTLLIQDAPVHTLHFVELLVNQIKKRGSRRQSLMALSTLTELLISDLLPDNRKLQTFSQHPFKKLEELASGNKDSRDKRLIMWYFEHLLKHHFAEFVQALEALAHDNVQATKAQALGTIHEILCNKPEQEKALLIQLVNKLGDPQHKMATKASYLLETLLHKHPNMKTVVCCEIERLLYRPNISLKAQYYAICFLNQMVLSHEEIDLAGKLIAIYFSFFHAFVKKSEIDSKMLSALLTGVNRAFPYSKMDDEKIMEQMDTLFKVVHFVNFTTSVQALMLLFQVMDSKQAISNRYYVALYRKLLDPGLAQSSKQAMFLNLLYKSLKSDIVLRRIKAFIKRILQATCGQTPAFICGALYLISEILKLKPGVQALLKEHWESDEEEDFRDVDDSEDKSEDLNRANMVNKLHEGEKCGNANKLEESIVQNTAAAKKPESTVSVSWLHHKNQEGGKSLGTYDPLHRNPLSCGADHAGLWELRKLSEHFHPSVALFATTILQGNHIQYSGDPLQDFTLMRFLDRFVYRNPKQQKGKGNTDSIVMQPKQKLLFSDPHKLQVNSKKFIEQEESQIPVDEIFFHRYYKKLDALQKSQRFHRGEEAVEDVDDDEFEQLLDSLEGDKYLKTIEDSLDFASNMKPKSSKETDDQVDSDDDDDEMSNLDDEEVSLGSLDEEDFGEVVGEDGGLFMNNTDDEEVDRTPAVEKNSKSGKRKKGEDLDFSTHVKGKKRKGGFKNDGDMFAAAEEFGCLLDENAGSKFDNIGINAMANKDKASIKQLQWESDRDAWIRGKDAHTLRRQKNLRAKRLKNKQKRFLHKKR